MSDKEMASNKDITETVGSLSPLMMACYHNDHKKVTDWLKDSKNNETLRLMYKCAKAWIALKKLVSEMPDTPTRKDLLVRLAKVNIAAEDNTGKVALHYAAENGNLVSFLQVFNADPSLIDHRDEDGYTPLNLAVMSGKKEIAAFLLSKGADANHVDAEKHSLIHWATVCGHLHILDTLLGHSALPSTPDLFGAHALHYATQLCNDDSSTGKDILHSLLKHGANPNCTDIEERTPLLWAASSGAREAVLILINAGADKRAVDKDSLSSLHCAASRDHAVVLATMLDLASADSSADPQDRNGCTPLFYAITMGHLECAKILLENTAKPNHQDRKLRTAAHYGAAKGQLASLKLLQQYGASFNLQNHRGDLPLHEAVESCSTDLVRWLLSVYPASAGAANHEGRTGLHLAAAAGHLELCRILGEHKAELNSLMLLKDDLATPLDVAIARDKQDVVAFLRKKGAKTSHEMPQDQRTASKESLVIKMAEARSKRHATGISTTDSQVSSDGGYLITNEERKKHRKSAGKHRRSASRKAESIQSKQTALLNQIEPTDKLSARSRSDDSSVQPVSTASEKHKTDRTRHGEAPSTVRSSIGQPEDSNALSLNLRNDEVGDSGRRRLRFLLESDVENGSETNRRELVEFSGGRIPVHRIGSLDRYIEEKRIFQELANLKRMQIQFGSVREETVVNELQENFRKQYKINADYFGNLHFKSFRAWEKFLYDQLKLLYYEEREKMKTGHKVSEFESKLISRQKSSGLNNQTGYKQKTGVINQTGFIHQTGFKNPDRIEQLIKTYGVAPPPLSYSPRVHGERK